MLLFPKSENEAKWLLLPCSKTLLHLLLICTVSDSATTHSFPFHHLDLNLDLQHTLTCYLILKKIQELTSFSSRGCLLKIPLALSNEDAGYWTSKRHCTASSEVVVVGMLGIILPPLFCKNSLTGRLFWAGQCHPSTHCFTLAQSQYDAT